jgi:hypothetical protein
LWSVLADSEQGRTWISGHDTIDFSLLERALAYLPGRPHRSAGRVHGAVG